MDEKTQEENDRSATIATKAAMLEGALAALCLTLKEDEEDGDKLAVNISLTVRHGHPTLKMDLYALAKLIEVVAPQHISSMKKYRADFVDFIFSHTDNEEESENENTEENAEKEND